MRRKATAGVGDGIPPSNPVNLVKVVRKLGKKHLEASVMIAEGLRQITSEITSGLKVVKDRLDVIERRVEYLFNQADRAAFDRTVERTNGRKTETVAL